MISFDSKEDRERFVAITRFLVSKKVPVPGILSLDDDQAVITEFVEGGLFSAEKKSGHLFAEVLRVAGIFAGISPGTVPANYKVNSLDIDRLRFEMNYFFLNFCSSYLCEKPSEKVKESVYKLTEDLGRAPAVFAHRDYHSENIMVAGNSIFVVDYQDALMAPRCYDFASLYVDGYRKPSPNEKKRILAAALTATGADPAEFMKTSLQRALKALGTFGYQVMHRKKERYGKAAVLTAGYLDELATDETLSDPSAVDFARSIKKKLT